MKREIRASLVAGMAGPGAVIDVGSESFVIPGIETWRQGNLRVVDLKRLSARLHKILKAPKEESPSLQVRRFPRAMFCEKCRCMARWKTEMEKADSEPLCPQEGCGGKLVSMRFVVACENGHLDDVDWDRWAHSGPHGNRGCRFRDRLSFAVDAKAATGGLASLKVTCGECGSSRSLEDLSNKALVKGVFGKCRGRHPWVHDKSEDCDADVVVLQRGATNLHYPSTISALDIPIDAAPSAAAQFAGQVREHSRYRRLVEMLETTEGDRAELLDAWAELIAGTVGCDVSIVLEIATSDSEGRPIDSAAAMAGELDQNMLLDEEWKTIVSVLSAGEMIGPNFAATSEGIAASSPAWMKNLVKGVVLARRLREVRVYRGFQRVKPGGPDKTVPADIGGSQNWLPASEVFGEGVLLALDFDTLRRWADQIPDTEAKMFAALEERRINENYWFLPAVDPIFLAVHTLSHLLLRRITFECGYSSSSLRERLYFSAEGGYAGIMIYTADSDSEGSLGGLVRQGRRDRLSQTVLEAIDQGRWCSSDPVCSETAGQGLGGFNHAACHACSLVSETSCTVANTLLDRRTLFDENWGLLQFLEEPR